VHNQPHIAITGAHTLPHRLLHTLPHTLLQAHKQFQTHIHTQKPLHTDTHALPSTATHTATHYHCHTDTLPFAATLQHTQIATGAAHIHFTHSYTLHMYACISGIPADLCAGRMWADMCTDQTAGRIVCMQQYADRLVGRAFIASRPLQTADC
jgi:hypothetical protein